MKLQIPEPLQLREEAICTALRRAAGTGGETGEAAELLEAILLPHLEKESVDVLQPLGLLSCLARGEVTPEMAELIPQIDQLASDRRDLRVEHATILSGIKRLVAAAREEGKSRHVRFAERLLFRAWLDESIFSPLAILIGKYLRLRLHPSATFTDAPPSLGARMEFDIPESLRVSHAQLNAALAEAMRVGGQTMVAAEVVAPLLELHLHMEDKEVLRILGLLEPLQADGINLADAPEFSELDEIETIECALHEEHVVLVMAAEKLLASAHAEGADEVAEFAERLLLRIRLDEEIFYPAALLVRNYLRLKRRNQSSAEVASSEKGYENRD